MTRALRKLRLIAVFFGLWVFFAGLLYIAGAVVSIAHADTHNLSLARIILVGDGVEQDSYVIPPRAQGSMVLETDAKNLIRSIEFDAWFRGDDQPLVDDVVTTIDNTDNGARYEVVSLRDNAFYFISFLRRAPPDEGYDPAVVLLLSLEGGDTVILDYRYGQ